MSVFTNNCLSGGTYLVTGASSGIGREAALLISQCGGRVIASGRDGERLRQLVSDLDSRCSHHASVQTLTDADLTAEWVKELVSIYGPFAGAFHAAGVEMIRPSRLTKQAHLNEAMGSSLFAAFGIARALSQKDACTDGGSLVFMSSVAGSTGQAGMTAYSAAKAGVDGFVRSLACELAPRKIRVNSIAAGAVKTAMHDRLLRSSGDSGAGVYESSHLLGFGDVADVAAAVVFLLTPASRWITGSTLAVDGGYMVR